MQNFLKQEKLAKLFTIESIYLTTPRKTFETILGKGENAGYHHFLQFRRAFQLFSRQITLFQTQLSVQCVEFVKVLYFVVLSWDRAVD